MASLGKCLVFHLKYPAEMKRLYWKPKESDDEPDRIGLDDPERVTKMATAVGDAACEEAADFLELCAKKIDDYLGSLQLLNIKKRSKRGKMMRTWQFEAAAERDPWEGGCWFFYGFYINDQLGAVVPFFWRSGGRVWQEEATKVLGKRAYSQPGGDLGCESGTVALIPISILPTPLAGFDVDRDMLVEKVVQAFTSIAKYELESIFQAVREKGEEAPTDNDDSL
jgi:hypothetical protein